MLHQNGSMELARSPALCCARATPLSMPASRTERKQTYMKVLIVGGGKVGYYMAKTLLAHGHQPRVLERDHKLCEQIANELDIR